MLRLIIQLFMAAAGVIATWLVAEETPTFGFIQTMIAVCLITVAVALVAFWPDWLNPFRKR